MLEHDRLIQGMAVDGHFRVIAAQTTTAVETAREILDLSPVAADALGRAMTGSLLLARLLDKDVRNQYVTLRFEGNGPLGTVIADGSVGGNVRGYVANPVPDDPLLDADSAIGNGSLTVIRGTPPAGKPYTSQILLGGNGIATDITRYLMRSEQIASAVLLGVLNRRDGVASAGGIVIQAFPHATEEAIAAIEQRIKEAPPLSTLLEKLPIEDVVATVLHGVNYKQIDAGYTIPVSYTCQCTRDRALAPLALLGDDDLREMIDEGGTEVVCQFCGRKYQFGADELLALTAKHDA
ncbi:MAG: Hsp33 family molecular chaperone HslO [Acidobacteria bacterium]|nr:Hsp33 family molecular chaperone HslO [Acidobacteriota bacterium]MBV9477340.1 Hsp33 family molecular chaperone HslO [Acidobacteriota bacterium]